jgi:hypothetical protein
MPKTRLTIRMAAVALAAALGTGAVANGGLPTAAADTDLGCPAGASSNDGAIAGQLNGQLTGKMSGHMNAGNVACARVITQTVQSRGLSAHAATIAITTTIVETSIRNLDYGDASSVGLYQQIDDWGSFAERTNPVWATNAFLGAMLQRFPDGSWATRPVGEVCQAVQRSAYPERYQPQASDGAKIAAALWSGSARGADRDVSGDGAADLLTVHTDGKLYYYPNNIKTSNGVPFGNATWASQGATWGGVKHMSAGDISGDKHSDLMVVDAGNKLYYYPNNIRTSSGVPFGNATWASQGATWGGVKHMSAGDVSGDGFADLMVIDADGKLYYYPNNINGGNGVPFTGAAWASTGATWGGVKHMSTADVSGDGFADLLVVDGDGKLYYYPNNINSGNGVPFGNAAWASQAATWGGVTAVSAGDISGDGFADLMVIDADGKLYYYPNNMNANNGVPFTTAVWASTTTAWAGNRLAG